MKRSLLFLIALAVSASAQHIPDLYLHPSQPLEGDWRTIVDPYESGFYDYRWNQRDQSENPNPAEAIYVDAVARNKQDRVEYNFDTSPVLRVPGDWNTQRAELLYYEGSIWYRRKFDCAEAEAGGRFFLRFGAVNYRADVYLNGKRLGTHWGGFTPFDFEVTGRLLETGNSLVVRANNQRAAEAVPTLNTDWWNYGGITREVTLVHTPEIFIASHSIALESEESRAVTAEVRLSDKKAGEKVAVEIPDLGLSEVAETNAEGVARLRFSISEAELWSPENPRLYQFSVRHGDTKLTEPVGFRTVRTKGREILLNGRPVFLRGICIHEEYPIEGGGRVTTDSQRRQLLTWAKDLGCNFVRLAHYPHHERMTRLADEMGILVWSEVPVYWTIDWENADTFRNANRQVTDMVTRDINRASIIIWSMANETPVNEARTKFLGGLVETARSLDPTRLISAAMEKHGKAGAPDTSVVEDPLADQLDIIAFNQYTGWYDGLPEKCARVKWEIPYEKPVFISEFGGGAKQGFHGANDERWTEEFQADLYRQTFPMLERIDGFSGMSPWILVDFRSPKRLLPGIQDGFNRKGLISDEGVKKQAFGVLRDYYQKRAGD